MGNTRKAPAHNLSHITSPVYVEVTGPFAISAEGGLLPVELGSELSHCQGFPVSSLQEYGGFCFIP